MSAFWSGSAADFLQTPRAAIVAALAAAQIRHFRTNKLQQLRAWEVSLDLLRTSLATIGEADDRWVLLEYPLLRLGRRADAILLTPAAVIVLEFKVGATNLDHAGREQVEDYALDLQDFHAGCRGYPIVPVLVATEARAREPTWPLALCGALPVLDADAGSLGSLLSRIIASMPTPANPLQPGAWLAAPYRPVPTIVEAACMLYAKHGVADIAAARADTHNLTRTTQAVLQAIALARADAARLILFITGIPGAGKTLCGLNAAFGDTGDARATFLTGNPTLVHVLREALARYAIARGADRRAARQQMESAIQALPRFRDHYVARTEIPAERVIVVDEAQRCWSGDYAIRKTRDRPVQLSDSEPAHLLAIMERHAGFAAVICLVGSGQEIHDGEGGLAEWGLALRNRPGWRALAPPDLLASTDHRQRLGDIAGLQTHAALHLDVPVRQIRSASAGPWIDRVLAGDSSGAASLAEQAGGVPYQITRSLPALRSWLRTSSRGSRRCGLLASSGARRLRAEGLGVELPHMDAQAVARWFLDRWPDVRASDALEVLATEFSCQGLELDYAGVCWDGDLIRVPGQSAWHVRDFRGTRWTLPTQAETMLNQINTYRVLLTRARYETVVFVPRGASADATRDPAVFDAIADFLAACGATPLTPMPADAATAEQEPLLL
jgi:hypothetical protein